ncbi:RidA family protein [Streptomyces tendae]|uniref:RidA family protein n=1 Tax=Streptomyces tendae TaxID=1932 RepID=UPI00132FC5D8|nr:RidA family protein [Streptomyces tendae]
MPRRTSVYTDEYQHTNPVPAACRIDNVVYSGAIVGTDRERGTARTLDEQCAVMFRRLRDIVTAAGCDLSDIVKVTLWMADRRDRSAVNREWTAMFPDPADRPARHVVQVELDEATLIQCDFVAVLSR